MNLRKVFLILVMFGVWTPASGQNANLLKNPGGDEGSEHWRAFKDAKVEHCPTGGPCFVLRGGGYFIQDVAIPKDAVGQYAVFIGRGYSDGPTTRPSLYGHMMNAGDPSGGRIYAYLSGQQMTGSPESSHYWTPLWGIFNVKPGTRRISFFLQQEIRSGGYDGAATRFDDLGLYIFPTEQEARALVSQLVPGPQFGFTKAGENVPQCWLPRVLTPSLYGIQLEMSLKNVSRLFPEAVEQPSVVRALESAKSSVPQRKIRMLIENRGRDQDLKEVKRFDFHFHDGLLYGLTVELHSPQWKNVEEFIDQRAQLLNLQNLPQSNAWIPVEGNPTGGKYLTVGKYLICHGIEIRFYAAPRESANVNLISMTDTKVEATLAEAINLKP